MTFVESGQLTFGDLSLARMTARNPAIGQVRLWQPFWEPDAPVAMIEASGLTTPTAAFVASVFPYVIDATLLAVGVVLVCRPRIRSAWRFGAFLLFLVLKPSFDITANVVAGSVYGIGDFSQMAEIIGGVWAGALQASLLAGGISLTLAVMRTYGGRDAATAPPANSVHC